MAKKTSLKDIAQVVGVSTALVSYVLNNQKENRISKAVAQQIRKVAKELNYQPNQIARSLKTSKTRTLGLIVADIANPFSSALARVIEDEADKQDYTVIFGSSDENAQKGERLISTLLNRQVDGLFIAAPEGIEAEIAELQQLNIPFVLIDRYFPTLKTNYVALDNYGAIYHAVQHLIDSGYRKIGLVTFKTALVHLTERTRGYRTALADHQIPFQKRWLKPVSIQNLHSDMAKAIRDLTTGPQAVEAIVFASNMLSIQGLKQMKVRQLSVPTDVALVGFDETELYDLLATPLTYIKQPIQEMGRLATTLLLEAMTSPNRITQAHLEATLVVQDSTPTIKRATAVPDSK